MHDDKRSSSDPDDEPNEQIRLISRDDVIRTDGVIPAGGVVTGRNSESTDGTEDVVDASRSLDDLDEDDLDEVVIDLRNPAVDSDDTDVDAPVLPHWTEPATGEVPVSLMSDTDAQARASVTPGPARSSAPVWKSNNFGSSDHEVTFDDLGVASRLGVRTDMPGEDAGDDNTGHEDRSASKAAEGDAVPFSAPGPTLLSATGRTAGGTRRIAEGYVAGGQDDDRSEVDGTVDNSGQGSKHDSGHDSGHRFRASGNDPTEDSPVRPERTRALDSVSLTKRVLTGAAFAVAALVAFLSGPTAVLVLVMAVLGFAAVEYFDAIRRAGFRPATLLGLLGVVGLIGGAYARGEAALPLVLSLGIVFTFLWYLFGIIKDRPTINTALTLLGVVWIGLLGSFAALMLRLPDREGVAFLAGAVLVTIAYDTAAYLGGTLLGRHKLSAISPNKSWEGAAAGTVAAVLVGGLLVGLISPWSVTDAILLALVASVLAPLGDLAESNIKRDLGLKDMGRILPGHGGVLDRFDGMLLVLPATYYLVQLLNLS